MSGETIDFKEIDKEVKEMRKKLKANIELTTRESKLKSIFGEKLI